MVIVRLVFIASIIYAGILPLFVSKKSNNCHSHVATALNRMKYKGKTNWNMVDVWLMTVLKSKYVE